MPKITNDTAYPNVTVPDATDEVLVLQSDVLKKETITQIGTLIGGGGGAAAVEYNDSDVTINLTTADLNKVWLINNASAVTVNLPSVAAAQIGYWLEVHKMGAGNLTIDAADSDVINDSSAGGTIANTTAGQTYAAIQIVLATATVWRQKNMPLGTWTSA